MYYMSCVNNDTLNMTTLSVKEVTSFQRIDNYSVVHKIIQEYKLELQTSNNSNNTETDYKDYKSKR